MDSLSNLDKIADSLFPELKRELSAIQDDIRSAENRIGRIPGSLLINGTKEALEQCRSQLNAAHTSSVAALKAVHTQYPH
tara:strand:+ start:733 stop:972 length:240 start_codon:yes stop_codon:yes gene_type:complete